MRSPPWLKERLLWVAMGVTLVALLLGYGLKSPCLDVSWDGAQYDKSCYNDLQVIWAIRGLHEDRMPYTEEFNEYPVVSGLWMYAVARLVDTQDDFVFWNAIGLGALALLTTALLYSMLQDRRRVFLWAAATPLVLYAFHNWDLIAVFAAVAGWWAYRRDRLFTAGALFAIGASAKIWPGLFLPFVGLELLRRDMRWNGRVLPFAAGAMVWMVLLHVPFLLRNRSLYVEGYAWHLDRGPTFESFWNVARVYADQWSWGWLQTLASPDVLPTFSKVVFLGGLALLAFAVWQRRLKATEATFGGLLLMLVINQVFSLQYILWVIPFLVLLEDRVPWQSAIPLYAADLAVFLSIWPFFSGLGSPAHDALFAKLALAVAVRWLVLVLGLGMVVVWATGQGPRLGGAFRRGVGLDGRPGEGPAVDGPDAEA